MSCLDKESLTNCRYVYNLSFIFKLIEDLAPMRLTILCSRMIYSIGSSATGTVETSHEPTSSIQVTRYEHTNPCQVINHEPTSPNQVTLHQNPTVKLLFTNFL